MRRERVISAEFWVTLDVCRLQHIFSDVHPRRHVPECWTLAVGTELS